MTPKESIIALMRYKDILDIDKVDSYLNTTHTEEI